MFRALMEKLGTPRHDLIPDLSPFPTPDCSAIVRDLTVRRKGEQDGSRNYPASGSDQPTRAELDIDNRFRELVKKAERTLSEQWNAYSSRIRAGSIDQGDVLGALTEGRRKLEEARENVRAAQAELTSLRQQHLAAEQEFVAFRSRNGLDHRLPRYPSEFRRAIMLSSLFLMLVIESFLNGTFFARGSETGLVGGVSKAIALSAVNICVGFAAGFLVWRWARGRGAWRKMVWGIVALLLIALSFVINLFIATYRDLFAAVGGVHGLSDTVARMKMGLSGLADTDSLVLLVLGFVFSVIAAVEGFYLDDPFPGYGGVDRRRHDAEERLRAATQARSDENIRLKDDALNAIASALDVVQSRSDDRSRATLGRQAVVQAYARHCDDVQAAYEAVLRTYWEENERARSTPSPARFNSDPPRLSWLKPPHDSDSEQSSSEAFQQLKEGMNELLEEWGKLGSTSTLSNDLSGPSGG